VILKKCLPTPCLSRISKCPARTWLNSHAPFPCDVTLPTDASLRSQADAHSWLFVHFRGFNRLVKGRAHLPSACSSPADVNFRLNMPNLCLRLFSCSTASQDVCRTFWAFIFAWPTCLTDGVPKAPMGAHPWFRIHQAISCVFRWACMPSSHPTSPTICFFGGAPMSSWGAHPTNSSVKSPTSVASPSW
jgi:hypothetical protein